MVKVEGPLEGEGDVKAKAQQVGWSGGEEPSSMADSLLTKEVQSGGTWALYSPDLVRASMQNGEPDMCQTVLLPGQHSKMQPRTGRHAV